MYKKTKRSLLMGFLAIVSSLAVSCGDESSSASQTDTGGTVTTVPVTITSDGTALWAKSVTGGTKISKFTSMAADSNGNIYAAGHIYGTTTYSFGSGITAKGTSSGFNSLLVKYNASGIPQWAKTVTSGTSGSSFSGITVDSSNNIFAAGFISGGTNDTYTFGTNVTANPCSGLNTAVLVKFNSDGIAQWATVPIGGSDSTQFNTVAVDSNGNIYAGGIIVGLNMFTFANSVTVTGPILYGSIVLVKYNASGVAQWAKTMETAASESYINSIAVDSYGYIYAVGYVLNGPYSFGYGKTITGVNNQNSAFIVKYYTNGTPVAVKNITTTAGQSSIFNSISIDQNNNIYAAGIIYGKATYTIDPQKTVTGYSTLENAVLIKYDSTLTAQWGKSTSTGVYASIFNAVKTDINGNIYAAGYITGQDTYTFSDGISAAGAFANTHSAVIVKYDVSGNAVWAKSPIAASNTSEFLAVTVDPSGYSSAAGTIEGIGAYTFSSGVSVSEAISNLGSAVIVKYQ
jgi:hypothetical protein